MKLEVSVAILGGGGNLLKVELVSNSNGRG